MVEKHGGVHPNNVDKYGNPINYEGMTREFTSFFLFEYPMYMNSPEEVIDHLRKSSLTHFLQTLYPEYKDRFDSDQIKRLEVACEKVIRERKTANR